MEQLLNETVFTQEEIAQLYRRFRYINRSSSGTISKQELMLIPEFAMNPLCSRIIAVLDRQDDNQINFRQFAKLMSALNARAPAQDKLNLAFKCFDVDNDGSPFYFPLLLFPIVCQCSSFVLL